MRHNHLVVSGEQSDYATLSTKLSPVAKKKRAVYKFAAIAGFLFAICTFFCNDEGSVFLKPIPLGIVLKVLHLERTIESWNIHVFDFAVALADGVAFGLLTLPIGFLWQFIIKDTELPGKNDAP
jgi:hypothetical protein